MFAVLVCPVIANANGIQQGFEVESQLLAAQQ